MQQIFKMPVLLMLCSLVACSDTESQAEIKAADAVTAPVKQKASPHTVQGMKNTMDDARGVEDMLQKQADEQRRQIDNIR